MIDVYGRRIEVVLGGSRFVRGDFDIQVRRRLVSEYSGIGYGDVRFLEMQLVDRSFGDEEIRIYMFWDLGEDGQSVIRSWKVMFSRRVCFEGCFRRFFYLRIGFQGCRSYRLQRFRGFYQGLGFCIVYLKVRICQLRT